MTHWPTTFSVQVIRLYQRMAVNKQPTCRYLPTCSVYAISALEEWGFFKGWALALWRIARCHPWATQRVDEVPHKH